MPSHPLTPADSGSPTAFDHENAFYLSADVSRFSKFTAHLDLFRHTADVPGAVVECGVFKGASLMRWVKFRALLENQGSRKIVAFDVFGQFPDATYELDRIARQRFVESAGDQSISYGALLDLLVTQGLERNVELIQGDVVTTVPAYVAANPALRISLLHVDVDLYEPTRACLEQLFPRIARGGIAILDDYTAFPGANKAIEEYFRDREIVIRKLPYSANLSFVEVS